VWVQYTGAVLSLELARPVQLVLAPTHASVAAIAPSLTLTPSPCPHLHCHDVHWPAGAADAGASAHHVLPGGGGHFGPAVRVRPVHQAQALGRGEASRGG